MSGRWMWERPLAQLRGPGFTQGRWGPSEVSSCVVQELSQNQTDTWPLTETWGLHWPVPSVGRGWGEEGVQSLGKEVRAAGDTWLGPQVVGVGRWARGLSPRVAPVKGAPRR